MALNEAASAAANCPTSEHFQPIYYIPGFRLIIMAPINFKGAIYESITSGHD